MIKNYNDLLENLQARRYDEALRESILSDSFEASSYPDPVNYVLESMQEIDTSYAYKTFRIAKRVHEKIQKVFESKNIEVDFRYQGTIQTETHIVLYGGVELLVISESLDNRPWVRVQQLTEEILAILQGDESLSIDYEDTHVIKIKTAKPVCEIKVLPAVWLYNKKFRETRREIDRGICEFNLGKKIRRKYLPFLNIARINGKDLKCDGGMKNMIRLLRTLQRDSPDHIALNHYEICSSIYDIADKQLTYDPNHALGLLGVVSAQLDRLIKDKAYREGLISPSEKELVFGKSTDKIAALKTLKHELDTVTSDVNESLKPLQKDIYSEITY